MDRGGPKQGMQEHLKTLLSSGGETVHRGESNAKRRKTPGNRALLAR